ncbi:hypothetical protein ACK4QV_19710, partial [Proteus mirabilis]|uniref:hypothetical protein n=1 Tax=Proteus mirabilis TaxID=584 RepID=UPI003918AE5E
PHAVQAVHGFKFLIEWDVTPESWARSSSEEIDRRSLSIFIGYFQKNTFTVTCHTNFIVTCNTSNCKYKKRPAIAGLYVHYRSYSLGVVMLFFLLFLMVEIQTAASDDSEKNEQPQHA